MGERKLFDLNRDNLSLRLSFRSDVVKDYAERGDTRNIKPGVYFYTLNASEFYRSGKIVISK